MAVFLIEAPEAEPVTLTEAKAHCAIDSTDFDTLLTGYIAAVRSHVEKTTGRALVSQTWELRLSAFPHGAIELPRPPLQEVVSIEYVGTDGNTVTLPIEAYRVTGVGGDGFVSPVFGGRWPATQRIEESVSVTFKAGYTDDAASPPDQAANVPPDIKTAMLEMIADLFRNRETVAADQFYAIPMPATAKALLQPYRVWTLP